MNSFVELKGDVENEPCVRSVLNCTSGGATVMFWAYLKQEASLFDSDTLSVRYGNFEGLHVEADFYLESGGLFSYVSVYNPNQWNHIAIVAKYSNPVSLKTYLYGSLEDTRTTPFGSGYQGESDDEVYIGKVTNMGLDLIDELLYFPEPLSDNDVMDIYDFYEYDGHEILNE